MQRLTECLPKRFSDFELIFENERSTGNIPDDEAILSRLKEYEAKFC